MVRNWQRLHHIDPKRQEDARRARLDMLLVLYLYCSQ